MTLDDVMAGRIPQEIAQNPAKLTGLWNQVKQANPELMYDPGAETEWLALVEKNAIREATTAPAKARVMTDLEMAKKGLDDISSGVFNGMGDVENRDFRRRLLRLEQERNQQNLVNDIEAGRPIKASPPVGSILNSLL